MSKMSKRAFLSTIIATLLVSGVASMSVAFSAGLKLKRLDQITYDVGEDTKDYYGVYVSSVPTSTIEIRNNFVAARWTNEKGEARVKVYNYYFSKKQYIVNHENDLWPTELTLDNAYDFALVCSAKSDPNVKFSILLPYYKNHIITYRMPTDKRPVNHDFVNYTIVNE